MPAMLDDPARPTIYRASGPEPYPSAAAHPLPPSIAPRAVTLRDRSTAATLLPFASAAAVPPRLLAHLADQLNREIELGDTYPMLAPLAVAAFGAYWFQNFGAVMLLGEVDAGDADAAARALAAMEAAGERWERSCLGSFYVKPNYPGRSSHVCNGGFLVTDVARNKGVGRMMGECYLDWAPKLVRNSRDQLSCLSPEFDASEKRYPDESRSWAKDLRAIPTPSSTSSTRPTSPPAASGTRSASSASGACPAAAPSAPRPTGSWTR